MKKQVVLYGAGALFLSLQLLPVRRDVPPSDPGADLMAVAEPPARVATLLKQACYDCHSNHTRYPWYAGVQPVGWWLQRHVDDGRAELNFSQFDRYPAAERRELLDHCAGLIEKGRMPLASYVRMHPEARLTGADRQLVIDWLRDPAPARDSCDDPDMPVACCFADQPRALSPDLTISGAGEPLLLRGRIVRADGGPYAGVRLYVYHTDAAGRYTPEPGAAGPARWHGRHRGWLRSDADGRFTIRTIRPAQYPGRDAPPAHIHVAAWPADRPAPFWISDFIFPDDRARRMPGGPGLVELTREGPDWVGVRTIVLD